MFLCWKKTKQANPNVECCWKYSDGKVPVLCFCILVMLTLSLFTNQFIPCGCIIVAPQNPYFDFGLCQRVHLLVWVEVVCTLRFPFMCLQILWPGARLPTGLTQVCIRTWIWTKLRPCKNPKVWFRCQVIYTMCGLEPFRAFGDHSWLHFTLGEVQCFWNVLSWCHEIFPEKACGVKLSRNWAEQILNLPRLHKKLASICHSLFQPSLSLRLKLGQLSARTSDAHQVWDFSCCPLILCWICCLLLQTGCFRAPFSLCQDTGISQGLGKLQQSGGEFQSIHGLRHFYVNRKHWANQSCFGAKSHQQIMFWVLRTACTVCNASLYLLSVLVTWELKENPQITHRGLTTHLCCGLDIAEGNHHKASIRSRDTSHQAPPPHTHTHTPVDKWVLELALERTEDSV